jgi:hypothetical protein
LIQSDDDDLDEADGSVTPTIQFRRSTVSEASTDNESDLDRPIEGSSTGRMPLTTGMAYTRVPGSGVGNGDNLTRDGGT